MVGIVMIGKSDGLTPLFWRTLNCQAFSHRPLYSRPDQELTKTALQRRWRWLWNRKTLNSGIACPTTFLELLEERHLFSALLWQIEYRWKKRKRAARPAAE